MSSKADILNYNALVSRYSGAISVNEKIEILEALEDLSLSTTFDHSPFALEKYEELTSLPDLTYPQQLRLSWLFGLEDIDVEETVANLLASFPDNPISSSQDEFPTSSHEASTEEALFTLETLLQIDMFATDEQRTRILSLYDALTAKAVAEQDHSLQSRLLTLSAKYLLPRLASLSAKITDLASPIAS